MSDQNLAIGDRVITLRPLRHAEKDPIPAGTIGTVCGLMNGGGYAQVNFDFTIQIVHRDHLELLAAFPGPRIPADGEPLTVQELIELVASLVTENMRLNALIRDRIKKDSGCSLVLSSRS